MVFNENILEQVLIQDLLDKGYEYVYGLDMERDYHEVLLKDYFDEAMFRINPGIHTRL